MRHITPIGEGWFEAITISCTSTIRSSAPSRKIITPLKTGLLLLTTREHCQGASTETLSHPYTLWRSLTTSREIRKTLFSSLVPTKKNQSTLGSAVRQPLWVWLQRMATSTDSIHSSRVSTNGKNFWKSAQCRLNNGWRPYWKWWTIMLTKLMVPASSARKCPSCLTSATQTLSSLTLLLRNLESTLT